MRIIRSSLLFGLLIAPPAALGQMTTIIGNLPGNNGSQSAALEGGRIKAMGFTMPQGTAWKVSSVELSLEFFTGIEDPLVRIFEDSAGAPGAILGSLTNPAFPGMGIHTYSVAPPAPIVLHPGSTYWLVVWNNAGTMDWKASDPAQTPVGIATHAGSLFSVTNGPNPPGAAETSPTLNSYALIATPLGSGCYANCDHSTTDPVLNVADFSCFLTKFAAGNGYANCDNSLTPPAINIADFSCFLAKFAAGCP